MLILINKNFVAHKARNKLTAMIFSLTLGTVIFLYTAVLGLFQLNDRVTDDSGGADILV
jgi:hypothetical protein